MQPSKKWEFYGRSNECHSKIMQPSKATRGRRNIAEQNTSNDSRQMALTSPIEVIDPQQLIYTLITEKIRHETLSPNNIK